MVDLNFIYTGLIIVIFGIVLYSVKFNWFPWEIKKEYMQRILTGMTGGIAFYALTYKIWWQVLVALALVIFVIFKKK